MTLAKLLFYSLILFFPLDGPSLPLICFCKLFQYPVPLSIQRSHRNDSGRATDLSLGGVAVVQSFVAKILRDSVGVSLT